MNRAEALARLAAARRAHMATVRPDGGPHVVVVTFALIDGSVVTAIDHKPKTTQRLQRLVNIEHKPRASLLVDRYEDDDWSALWWVRIDGAAAIHEEGAVRRQGIEALAIKYPQYVESPPQGPVVSIAVEAVTSWASNG